MIIEKQQKSVTVSVYLTQLRSRNTRSPAIIAPRVIRSRVSKVGLVYYVLLAATRVSVGRSVGLFSGLDTGYTERVSERANDRSSSYVSNADDFQADSCCLNAERKVTLSSQNFKV